MPEAVKREPFKKVSRLRLRGTLLQYMSSYKLVKEFGEGVDRMFREMDAAGCPAPEYCQNEFMVCATLRQHKDAEVKTAENRGNGGLNEIQKMTLEWR